MLLFSSGRKKRCSQETNCTPAPGRKRHHYFSWAGLWSNNWRYGKGGQEESKVPLWDQRLRYCPPGLSASVRGTKWFCKGNFFFFNCFHLTLKTISKHAGTTKQKVDQSKYGEWSITENVELLVLSLRCVWPLSFLNSFGYHVLSS